MTSANPNICVIYDCARKAGFGDVIAAWPLSRPTRRTDMLIEIKLRGAPIRRVSGRPHALDRLRQIFAELHTIGMGDDVRIQNARRYRGEDGQAHSLGRAVALHPMLKKLFRGARVTNPYSKAAQK